ncbi:MAG TPA: hypothetical protein VJM83_00575, partial [Nitrospirota bacterium]|nr:hypothetical protein [Nitrospirota bacterium]
TSALTTGGTGCPDCHSATATTAHNGFDYTFVTGGDNYNSELCISCHGNGTDWNGIQDPVYSTVPSGHLGAANSNKDLHASHYLGTFTDNANDIDVKRTSWGNGFSKYGNSTTGSITRQGGASDTTGRRMVCESCHSVLYNAGAGSGATASSGYAVNLLLQDYKDDSDNASGSRSVGSGFCIACHNQGGIDAAGVVSHSLVKNSAIAPGKMHPMTNWTTTRARDAGFSGGDELLVTGTAAQNGVRASYADATNAPTYNGGIGPRGESYPAADAMDCDSCHRPHLADLQGFWTPIKTGGGSKSVILENATSIGGNNDYGTLCQDCHNM